jgi:hypothetical protein
LFFTSLCFYATIVLPNKNRHDPDGLPSLEENRIEELSQKGRLARMLIADEGMKGYMWTVKREARA